MEEAGIPDKEWPSRLISLLTGKALTASMEPYTKLKEALLEALGFSLDQCRRTFWSRGSSEDRGSLRSHGAEVRHGAGDQMGDCVWPLLVNLLSRSL